jgi:predicted house-cleaning noncanonical NTP pyrophosphatase (MazG superfamily)
VSKLVRDRIPEIMRREGRGPAVERIGGSRLREALKEKLVEESIELRDSPGTEELVDVLEVVDALIEHYGLDRAALEAERARKRAERGGFREGWYLKEQ